MKLTIMISLYNSGDWIKNRLDNLMESTAAKESEIWCVNANSPDHRDEEIPLQYPVIYHRLPERVSVYAAWNYIIEKSSSTYITNANTDDLVAPDCYNKLMSVLDMYQSHHFAYPSWYTTDVPNQQWSKLDHIDPSGLPGHFHGDIDKAGVGHFPLWRRSLHDKVGLFDASFKAAGDADFWMRCFYKADARFFWYNEFLACYLWRHGENLWQKAMTEDEWARFHRNVAEYRSQ